jgi:hypothetical protein
MEDRFLALDWTLRHPEILLGSFYEAPSLAAFRAVFVDPQAITSRWRHDVPVERDGRRRTYSEADYGLGHTLAQLMVRRRREGGDLLRRGGGVILCRLRPRAEALEIVRRDGPEERIDRYSWLPVVSLVDRQHQLTFPANGRFVARRGRDVYLEGSGSPIEEYLKAFSGHVEYTAVYEDLLSTPIERFGTVLARNRVGDILALEIPFDDGILVLLPPVVGVSPDREGSAVVEATRAAADRGGFVAEPDWTPSFPYPGEEPLRDEMGSITKRRERLDAKIQEATEKLGSLLLPKPMLYAKGRRALLPSVGAALGVLGFDVAAEGDHVIARSDEGDALVLASAVDTAAVDIGSYRQLLKLVDRAHTEQGDLLKGILVVSGSRELDPRHRPTQFSPAVLRGCQAQRFCLITAYDLYKLTVAVAEADDALLAADLRRQLTECEGEFRGASR